MFDDRQLPITKDILLGWLLSVDKADNAPIVFTA